jgi:hypothetical protein
LRWIDVLFSVFADVAGIWYQYRSIVDEQVCKTLKT